MSIHTIYAEFLKRTENHDEVVCTGPKDKGKIWPRTDEEKRASKKFADKVLKFLYPQAERLGYSWVRYSKAMEDLSKGSGEGE